MTYQPLHHKYRPQTFSDLVGQEAIATTLTNALHQQRIAPAYLFTGARGTGKTSSARILAKSLNCLAYEVPTEQPCGVCEVCQSIARGSALDVIEIDAASNTGVDNMRELIERSQFAPVQCRYKVYVVDECLVGGSLIWTDQGFFRIDDPTLLGKNVLSYNDTLRQWEFKPVLRWLDQGCRQTYRIKTSTQEIRCTGNHLIRTEQGWVAARDVKEGAKILSPVNVDAAPSFISLGRTGGCAALSEGTSLREISTGKKATTSVPFLSKLNRLRPFCLCGCGERLEVPRLHATKGLRH
jgi:DNA polymerase-3 subunit gamma/tau